MEKMKLRDDYIYINRFRIGKRERELIEECINSDWFNGESIFNKRLENMICSFAGVKYFQTMNSGTSALNIAVQVLLQTGRIKRGDKFLHPIMTFATSLSSAIMADCVPVYVDIDEGTYQISTEGMKKALHEHPDIKFAIIPALFGNLPNMDVLKEVLEDRYLIVDSCDTMGSKWDNKEFISYGDMGSYSTYASHHISTMVGGGLATNNDEFYELAKSMTFWGRDFETDKLDIIDNFLKRYSYKTLGTDSQMSALQAAIGCAQFEKIHEIIGRRKYIFEKLQKLFSSHQSEFILPMKTHEKADPSWFGYCLCVRPNAKITRRDFVKYLLDNKVEIRPLMSANILNNPPFMNKPHYIVGEIKNSNNAYNHGFFIPAYAMNEDEEKYYFEVLERYLND